MLGIHLFTHSDIRICSLRYLYTFVLTTVAMSLTLVSFAPLPYYSLLIAQDDL